MKRTRPRLIDAGYLFSSEQEEVWRISVRVTAGEDLDYDPFQRELRAQVEPILEREQAEGVRGLSAVYTGAVPIIYKARRNLLDGLILGFGTDVLLVVVSIIILMRHWSSGVLLFLTSVFPVTIVFGIMGWCGWLVDIGSVMAPCVALGVTIDDAIHFLLWFGRGISRGLSQPNAVTAGIRRMRSCDGAELGSHWRRTVGLCAEPICPDLPFRSLDHRLANRRAGLQSYVPASPAGGAAWRLSRRSNAQAKRTGARLSRSTLEVESPGASCRFRLGSSPANAAAAHRAKALVTSVADRLFAYIVEYSKSHLVRDVGEAQLFFGVGHAEGTTGAGQPNALAPEPNCMARLGREKPKP